MEVQVKSPLTRLGKSAARVLLHKGGLLGGVRYKNRQAFRILMYHDFLSTPELQEALARQCAHINRYYHAVSMTDIARSLREGTRLPPNALAITVDDGGRDFLLHGFPVFKSHRIPVTLYLLSGFLDKKWWLWWDQVSYMIENSRRSFIYLSFRENEPPIRFALDMTEQRKHAKWTIIEVMKELGESERGNILKRLPQLLDVELPKDPPPHMEPLEWSEVRQMADQGVEFGAHTVTHPILSRIADEAVLLEEIGHSKKRIETELSRPVLHFCYPYGCWEDFNDQTLKVVEQCQFQTAVTAELGMNYRDTHPFKLTRLGMEATMPDYYFKEMLAGLHTR